MTDHESTDRYMSGWVVAVEIDHRPWYVAESGGLTPSVRTAAWRRWVSETSSLEALAGPGAHPVPVAEALARLA